MKKPRLYFTASPKDLSKVEYLDNAESWQVERLSAFAKELEERGEIDHADARYLGQARWSLWCRREGADAVNHICYLSSDEPMSAFAKSLYAPANEKPETLQSETKELVVLDPNGPRDSLGGRHPGYWTPEDFASRLGSPGRELFLGVANDIRHNRASPYYKPQSEGTMSVEIAEPGVILRCTLKWMRLEH